MAFFESTDLEAYLADLGVRDREPFSDFEALSGCRFERATAADGRSYVLKHMVYDEDWIMRATGDAMCRAAALARSPLHDRLPDEIDDALIGCVLDGAQWTLVMRDVSESLFPKWSTIREAQRDRLFSHLTMLHAEFWAQEPAAFLMSIQTRLRFLSPSVLERANPELGSMMNGMWEVFPEAVPADVAAAILRLHEDPSPVARRLSSCRSTFLHGDMKFPNLGSEGERTVALDWQLCTFGPPAVELGWFVALNATRCEGSREDAIASFEYHLADALGPRFEASDWRRSLDLSLVATFAVFGGMKAYDSSHAEDPVVREREQQDFDWWVGQVSKSLERIS